MIQYLNVFYDIYPYLCGTVLSLKLAALRLRAVHLARRLQPDAG